MLMIEFYLCFFYHNHPDLGDYFQPTMQWTYQNWSRMKPTRTQDERLLSSESFRDKLIEPARLKEESAPPLHVEERADIACTGSMFSLFI